MSVEQKIKNQIREGKNRPESVRQKLRAAKEQRNGILTQPYYKALRKMALDYIESMKAEANWGDYVEGKWINYPYPVTEQILELFISDYLYGTNNFFYGIPLQSVVGEEN